MMAGKRVLWLELIVRRVYAAAQEARDGKETAKTASIQI